MVFPSLPRSSRRAVPARLLSRSLAAVASGALAVALLSACGSEPTCSVTSVSITPSSVSVAVGDNVTVGASIQSSHCSPTPTASWSSSNTSVATVSASGEVTGVATGSAIITASAAGNTATASVTVTPAPIATITLAPAPASVIVGQTVALTATARDSRGNVLTGRTITWSSSNAGVASVAQTGVVTGVAAGTATITASAEGKSATSTVTVSPAPVATVTVTLASGTLAIGQTTTATFVARSASGQVLTGRSGVWSSTNVAVGTVQSSTGQVTAISRGSASIRVNVEGVIGQATLTVIPALENQRYAYVWVDQANAALNQEYTPNTLYSFNLTGGAIAAKRTGVGAYQVRFGRLAKAGVAANRETVLISAYGSAGEYCVNGGWGDDLNGTDLVVYVSCFNVSRAATDALFNVSVIGSSTIPARSGFLWNPDHLASGAASTSYGFSTSGGAQSITRASAGTYVASLGLSGLSSSVAVASTYVGSSLNGAACGISSWNITNGVVNVLCQSTASAGVAADSRFTTLLTESGRAGARWGFAWNDSPSATTGVTYVPSTFYQKQSNGQQVSMVRTGTGAYTITFAGLNRTTASQRETLQVSAYGGLGMGRCQIAVWVGSGSDIVAFVRCFSMTTGAPQDNRFSILLLE